MYTVLYLKKNVLRNGCVGLCALVVRFGCAPGCALLVVQGCARRLCASHFLGLHLLMILVTRADDNHIVDHCPVQSRGQGLQRLQERTSGAKQTKSLICFRLDVLSFSCDSPHFLSGFLLICLFLNFCSFFGCARGWLCSWLCARLCAGCALVVRVPVPGEAFLS